MQRFGSFSPIARFSTESVFPDLAASQHATLSEKIDHALLEAATILMQGCDFP